eukprot:466524-Rhodomonas_salina.1
MWSATLKAATSCNGARLSFHPSPSCILAFLDAFLHDAAPCTLATCPWPATVASTHLMHRSTSQRQIGGVQGSGLREGPTGLRSPPPGTSAPIQRSLKTTPHLTRPLQNSTHERMESLTVGAGDGPPQALAQTACDFGGRRCG